MSDRRDNFHPPSRAGGAGGKGRVVRRETGEACSRCGEIMRMLRSSTSYNGESTFQREKEDQYLVRYAISIVDLDIPESRFFSSHVSIRCRGKMADVGG
ncbi:uncharacterized protein LAJ45_04814 [Morchella importuna]|uniref:uncharacterized protein n=1 Tax=Morchella importuna TaxID=1174673 RepID=UPI001E8E0B7F|nr:uncharacterized protein LAJ45_04814 [Morchella importuna]KAH8151112.1 hypothetical protein LAJ45_04814 [Morchella importuna]